MSHYCRLRLGRGPVGRWGTIDVSITHSMRFALELPRPIIQPLKGRDSPGPAPTPPDTPNYWKCNGFRRQVTMSHLWRSTARDAVVLPTYHRYHRHLTGKMGAARGQSLGDGPSRSGRRTTCLGRRRYLVRSRTIRWRNSGCPRAAAPRPRRRGIFRRFFMAAMGGAVMGMGRSSGRMVRPASGTAVVAGGQAGTDPLP